jgi:hypothetical protein
LKIVTIIGDESSAKTWLTAGLGDRPNIDLYDYTADILGSIILDDQMDAAIYVSRCLNLAIENTEEIESIAMIRSVTQFLILVGNRQVPQVNIDMFIPINQFGEAEKAVKQIREIRAFVEMGGINLPKLSGEQLSVLKIHCSLLPEKMAIKKSMMSRRKYYRTLDELKLAFNVFDNCELRRIFCTSQIPSQLGHCSI